jgi:hypothetical protein
MRLLIATDGHRQLIQTGVMKVWEGTPMEEVLPVGVVVDEDGTEIETRIWSSLARGYWDIVAEVQL